MDDLLEHPVWFVLREGRLTRDVDRRVEAREAPHVRPSRTYGPTAIAEAGRPALGDAGFTMTAVAAARRRLGISMMPRAL